MARESPSEREHVGQRQPFGLAWYAVRHAECSAWPHRNRVAVSRELNMSSRQTAQSLRSPLPPHLCEALMALGKHAPHPSQWKKFARPPTRQMPQLEQCHVSSGGASGATAFQRLQMPQK
jgi:hypothetical protein